MVVRSMSPSKWHASHLQTSLELTDLLTGHRVTLVYFKKKKEKPSLLKTCCICVKDNPETENVSYSACTRVPMAPSCQELSAEGWEGAQNPRRFPAVSAERIKSLALTRRGGGWEWSGSQGGGREKRLKEKEEGADGAWLSAGSLAR